jgi:hypothetical protein
MALDVLRQNEGNTYRIEICKYFLSSSTAAPCKSEKSEQDRMQELLDGHGFGSKLLNDREYYEE